MKNISKLLLISLLTYSCTTTLPVMVTSNKVEPTVFKGCTTSLFALTIGEEENLVYQISQKYSLDYISSVDTVRYGVYPIYWEDCTYISAKQSKTPRNRAKPISETFHKEEAIEKTKRLTRPKLAQCEGLNERDYEECVERALEK